MENNHHHHNNNKTTQLHTIQELRGRLPTLWLIFPQIHGQHRHSVEHVFQYWKNEDAIFLDDNTFLLSPSKTASIF